VELIRTYQLPVFVDDLNLLGENVDTIKKSTQTLLYIVKKTGLEIKAEKTKHIFMSRHSMNIAHESENVGKFE
jgi:hypothetical protein